MALNTGLSVTGFDLGVLLPTCIQIFFSFPVSHPRKTQGFDWDGKGETGNGKKVGGGEGKGKRKGEALGSFSIQIISRSITFLSRYWPHF